MYHCGTFLFEQCVLCSEKYTNMNINDDCGFNKEAYGVHVMDVDYCDYVT
jgi:hypothetical protein